MAVGKILRKPLKAGLEIEGQEIINGEYQETINKFNTVYGEELEEIAQVIKLSDPDVLPPSQIYDVAFSPDGKYLATVGFSEPYFAIYKRTGKSFTKLPNPTFMPTGISNAVVFSEDGLYLAVGYYFTSPYIIIYKVDNNNDQFTKVVDPSPAPPGTVHSISFGLNSTYLATAHLDVTGTNNPRFSIYKRTGDNFNRLANLSSSTLDQFITNSVHFAPDASYFAAIGDGGSDLSLFVYKRSGDTFTRLTSPELTGFNVRFSNNADYLIVGRFSFTPMVVLKRSGDNFNILSNAIQPSSPNGIRSLGFTQNDKYLITGSQFSPYIRIFERDGDTFTQIPNPDILPINAQRVDITKDGRFSAVAMASGTPSVNIYDNQFKLLVFSADNIISDADLLGYALEDGTTGETKKVMSLFKKEE